MPEYPLIYGVRDVVTGNGFVAGVAVAGRALMVQEEDAWWVYGVEPGGLAAHGATSAESYLRFRETLQKVLYDSAALTDDFEAFRQDVAALCQADQADAARWEAARLAVREGSVVPEGPMAELPRSTAEVQCSVTVRRLDHGSAALRAEQNASPSFETAA